LGRLPTGGRLEKIIGWDTPARCFPIQAIDEGHGIQLANFFN
jgi:hypothetical protein